MRADNSSAKKYFLNFYVLEKKKEKRKPGPFAIQAIPNTNQKIKKYIGKERKERLLPLKEPFITSQIIFGPSIR